MLAILKFVAGAISASCVLLAVIDLCSKKDNNKESKSINFLLISTFSSLFFICCLIDCQPTSILTDEKLAAPIRPSVNLYDIRCT